MNTKHTPDMAHTPGPWSFVDATPNCFPSVLIGYRDGLRYSDRSGSDESSYESCRKVINVGPSAEGLAKGIVSNDMDTIVANARLIAAAPNLLAALIALRDEANKIAGRFDVDGKGFAGTAPIWAFIADATDAIAKAKGGAA